MPGLGMETYDRFWVRDEITGEEYHWGQANYVRLDPAKTVAHIVNLPRVPDAARIQLFAQGVIQ
jgi:starch synthase (maltosyl-transferring)